MTEADGCVDAEKGGLYSPGSELTGRTEDQWPAGQGSLPPREQAVPAAREYGSGSEQQAATPGRSTADNNT